MGNVPSRNDHFPVPPGFMPPLYPGYPQFSTSTTTWNPFKRNQMKKREKALREYLYTTPMILQYPGAFAVTQPGQNIVQPGIPQVHAAIPVAAVTSNGLTGQMSAPAQMMVSGAGAPAAPGAGGAGAGAAVIPSQMMPMNYPTTLDYSTFLDPRGGGVAAPVIPRRSRRSQRHRNRDRDRRRSDSQSSGSSGSDPESPYSASSYDSDEYPRNHRHHHRSNSGRNPLPRPPKDILSSTPFRPLLTQLPSAQYNSWGLGGTSNPIPHHQHQHQQQTQPEPVTYGNVRPRRRRRGFFNSRPRDQFPVTSMTGVANSMSQPPYMGMTMPEAQPGHTQQQPPAGFATPGHMRSPMPMPNPEPAPPHPQGPVIPAGTNIPMPSPAPAGSTPFIGASLGTPRTPRMGTAPPSGQMMQMNIAPSPSSGHVPMPTPMTGQGGNMPMVMPSPAVGPGGFAQPQMMMPPPGSVLVNATMSMPSPSLGGGGMPGGGMAPVLKFNGYGEYAGLLYHSPHSVVYEEDLYPTALHLFEARKFLDHRPDLADRIRQCERVEEVTAISAEVAEFTRRDWGNVALSTMDDVLYLKFRQHGDLRALLLNTYPADLVYVESGDPFWGDGAGAGMNELGNSLVRVRERIRFEGGGM